MNPRSFTDLISARHFLPIAAALLFVAMGDAVSGPYIALFANDKAQLSPFQLGGLLTLRAACSIGIGYAFGRWFDKKPTTVPLFLALSCGMTGFILLSLTTNYVALLAIVALPLATGAASFPQLFAVAKGNLDKSGPITAERGVSLLRALWSVAWAIGPAIGAAVIVPYEFEGVFLTTALFAAIAIVIILAARIRAPARAEPEPGTSPRRVPSNRDTLLAALALTFFHMAMFMGSVALSISVIHDMGGSKSDVGHAYSICAFLEVFVMMGFVVRPVNPSSRKWLSAGFAAFALYFAIVAVFPSVTTVLAAQAIRAVGIGIVGCLGIGYAQAAVGGRVGAAAALFANSVNAGALLSGLATGVWAHLFGYGTMFGACAGLSGLGLLILQFQPRPQPPGFRNAN